MNPVAIATQARAEELSTLRSENERLKQRVSLLETGGADIADLTVQVESRLKEPGSSKELEGKPAIWWNLP